MLLDVSRMTGVRDRIEREYERSAWAPAGDYAVTSRVRLAVDVHKDRDRFRLAGRVEATLEVVCGRCLEPFALPVDATFDLRYLPHAENTGEGEREVEEDDLDTAFYRDQVIDLGELMREQFLLALPMKPLCREGCKGLCPVCGTNLNDARCQCGPQWADPRLAGLRALLDRKD